MQYLDLTHTFTSQIPVFPGDPAIKLVKIADVVKDGFVHYEIETGMHAGTHMDGPAHMLEGGKYLNEYPVEKFFAQGVILDARGKSKVDESLIENKKIGKGYVVLICFGWSKTFGEDEYYLNYPEVSESLAKKLSEMGVSMLGLDTPSPDRAPYTVHKELFKSDILIIENLTNLEQLIGKFFELIALPAKFETDSAPCRAVAKVLDL